VRSARVRFALVRQGLRRRPAALAGLAVLALVVLAAAAAPLVAPYGPLEQHRQAFLEPPAWASGGASNFLFGTDAAGRDLFSRVLHGARISLGFSVAVVGFAVVVGVSLGVAAAFARPLAAATILRTVDLIQTVPVLLLALTVLVILGPGEVPAILSLSIVLLPGFARVARAATLAELGKDYALASRALGGANAHLMLWVVLPNIGGPLVVQGTLAMSDAILGFAALGFLGLGIAPPVPEWGTMLAEARPNVLNAWWTVVVPGAAILVTVLSLNLVADGLRDALDPKATDRI
jgi:dipeptide transport system permease protein